MSRKSTRLVHEGKYAAEVEVELIEDDSGWSPYLSVADASKLDLVRKALRQGDLVSAAKHARERKCQAESFREICVIRGSPFFAVAASSQAVA